MDGNYNIVDLFSGVGGLSLGFNQNNFRTLFVNDIDKYALETYKKNHNNTQVILDDIKNISKSSISKLICNNSVDVLMAGIPCQSFSMSGYRIRNGIDNSRDPRHFLYKEFFRVLDFMQPKIAIIENVMGIISSNKGIILKEIINSFINRKYEVEYKILDSSNYGVPQTRKRVFIIASKVNKKIIFPQKKNYITPVNKILLNIPDNIQNHDKRYFKGINLERALNLKPGENWKYLPKKLRSKSIHSGAYGRIDPNKPSKTLTTRFDTPSVGFVTHPFENRTLTIREGARIQTFPDDFIFYGPKMSQYKQIGNAVPVKLAYEISICIKFMLDDFYGNL